MWTTRTVLRSKAFSARRCLVLLSLAFLSGCEKGGDSQEAGREITWPQVAIVADLSLTPLSTPAEPLLTNLKAMGFDTVLLDARTTPTSLLAQQIRAAKLQQLYTVIRTASPADDLSGRPGETIDLQHPDMVQADGWVLTLEHPGQLEYARALRMALQAANPNVALIADMAVDRAGVGQQTAMSLPGELFDIALHVDESAGILSRTARPGENPPVDLNETAADGLPRWHRTPLCEASVDQPCSNDVRLLAMAFMQSAAPVTDVIEGDYWHDVYASLIKLRKSVPWIREGKMQWYAAGAEADVLAYRLISASRQHILVAINVSDRHHELPLPFGFMSVSKVRLWASYDPEIRELVTSKPILLPARSAVVVVDD
jgi:hypothetical protein